MPVIQIARKWYFGCFTVALGIGWMFASWFIKPGEQRAKLRSVVQNTPAPSAAGDQYSGALNLRHCKIALAAAAAAERASFSEIPGITHSAWPSAGIAIQAAVRRQYGQPDPLGGESLQAMEAELVARFKNDQLNAPQILCDLGHLNPLLALKMADECRFLLPSDARLRVYEGWILSDPSAALAAFDKETRIKKDEEGATALRNAMQALIALQSGKEPDGKIDVSGFQSLPDEVFKAIRTSLANEARLRTVSEGAEAAINWLKTSFPGSESGWVAEGVLNYMLSEGNYNPAQNDLKALGMNESQFFLQRAMKQAFADPQQAARDYVRSVQTAGTAQKSDSLTFFAYDMAQAHPEALEKFRDGLPAEMRAGVEEGIAARQLVSAAGVVDTTVLNGLAPGVQQGALGLAITMLLRDGWASQRPDDIIALLNTDAGSHLEQAKVTSIITSIGEANPQLALQQLDRLKDDLTIRQTQSAILTRWIADEPWLASEFLRSAPPGSYRDAGSELLAINQASEDPEAAVQWLVQIDDPAERNRAAGRVKHLLPRDFLKNISSGYAQLPGNVAAKLPESFWTP